MEKFLIFLSLWSDSFYSSDKEQEMKDLFDTFTANEIMEAEKAITFLFALYKGLSTVKNVISPFWEEL